MGRAQAVHRIFKARQTAADAAQAQPLPRMKPGKVPPPETLGQHELRASRTGAGGGVDAADIVMEGVRAEVMQRLGTHGGASFAKISWLFEDGGEPGEGLEDGLGRVHAALNHMQDPVSTPAPRRSQGSAIGPHTPPVERLLVRSRKTSVRSTNGPTELRRSILRTPNVQAPKSPEGNTFLVQSLSAPSTRPKSVRVADLPEETRFFESDAEVGFHNQETRGSFLSVEGRWGLRFPSPVTVEEDRSDRAPLLHDLSVNRLNTKGTRKKVRAGSLEAALQDVRQPENVNNKLVSQDRAQQGGRGQTPKRMGFAGLPYNEMAYHTGQIPSKLRLEDQIAQHSEVLKISRGVFTPAENQRTWERGLSSERGLLGPSSRHVQTRAGRVVEEAKERAMVLRSPRNPLTIFANGSYHSIPGVQLCPCDATPMQALRPYPVFNISANDGSAQPAAGRSAEEETDQRESSTARVQSEPISASDREVIAFMSSELMKQGLLPKTKSPDGSPQPSMLYMTFEEMSQKLEDAEKRKFERIVHMVEKDVVAPQIKWGPRSRAHQKVESIRRSQAARHELANYVKNELPRLRRQEMAEYYKTDMLERNRRSVSELSMARAQENRQKKGVRSESVPLTLMTESERMRRDQEKLKASQRRKDIFIEAQEHNRRSKQLKQDLEAQARAVAEDKQCRKAQRIQEKSDQIRQRDFSQPFLAALMVIVWAFKAHPKAGKLKPKRKTNVKFVIRIQRWYRFIHAAHRDPFRRKNIKDLMGSLKKEDKILARARHMIHMWQKAKHVGAIIYFLRALRDDRPDVLQAVNAKYSAARVIQTCGRAFLMSRKTSWMVWEMQWLTLEQGRNRALIKRWKDAWKATMQEISKVVKVIPGQPKKTQGHRATKWVGHVMDNFIANLPEEVKNIMDVPSHIRRYLLACHKVKLVEHLVLKLDQRKRVINQKRADRKVRDELTSTFPHLADMNFESSELRFLHDVDSEPPIPHLPLALKHDDLEKMLCLGQTIARGEAERPTSPDERSVLKAIPGGLDHVRLNGLSLDDPADPGEAATLGRYLGRNRGLSKELSEQCVSSG